MPAGVPAVFPAVVPTVVPALVPAVVSAGVPADAITKVSRYNVCPQTMSGYRRRHVRAVVATAATACMPAVRPTDAFAKDLR